jgi:predicted lipid-binding transport protein (Tim44 family)
MRGLFGAVAGGMLTSMLLRSLGINLAFPGLEIILWAVVGYFVLRWLLRRFQSRPSPQFRRAERAVEDPLVTGIAREVAADIFYKVQQGWMARRIGQLSGLLGPTIEEEFRRDLDALHSAGQVNSLEQINLNQVTVMHTWQEESCDYSYVRMAASMVDYTVDERSGAVVEGSATQPVTFEECWIFEKALGSPQWRLVGIEQESAAKASCG